MSYSATAFTVFIASPSDVIKERVIIRDIISEWNIINSLECLIVLQPLGWDSDVYPILNGKPQSLINNQILKNADLLIGVFWTRIGTPTYEYESGTVEEIQKHIEAGKPAMIYFSNQPVKPDSINLKQYEKLKKFKKWCEEKGIIDTYDNERNFHLKINKHINLILKNHSYFKNLLKGKIGDSIKSEIHLIPNLINRIPKGSKKILKEAVKGNDGIILRVYTFNGMKLNINGEEFGPTKRNARLEAELEGDIDFLEMENLIKATDYKREVFRVTSKGYKFADKLS